MCSRSQSCGKNSRSKNAECSQIFIEKRENIYELRVLKRLSTNLKNQNQGRQRRRRKIKRGRVEDRRDKSSKKPRTKNNKADNRYVTYYTNYTPLNTPIDYIVAVTRDKLIFGDPDVIRHDRLKRDAHKFCRFHKDIGMI